MARPKKYKMNDFYFDKIDSPNKSYLFGFIFGDGSISDQELSIMISNKDVEILEFLKRELETTRPISSSIINGVKYPRISITSKRFVAGLKQNGLVENKTYNTKKLLMNETDENFRHFLRGLFDADGSIYKKSVRNGIGFCVAFTGNFYILRDIKQILKKQKISSSKIRFRYNKNNSNSCMLEINGRKNISKFYDFVYDDFSFCLSRKKKIFDEFFEFYKNRNKIYYEDVGIYDKIEKMYQENKKQIEISTELDIPYSSVRGIVQKLRKMGKIK